MFSRREPVDEPREGYRLPHVREAADIREGALDAEPEARVRERSVPAQVEIPLERLLREAVLLDPLLEEREVVDALTAADDLPVPLGGEEVDGEAELRIRRDRAACRTP